MITRRLCGRDIVAVGQGTWRMEDDDRAACITALRAGLDAGATHVDTAELYGAGEVEELVGEAIAGRRDQVFLVSKVMPKNATRAGTVKACEQSLQRLRTDRLDLYLLHWPGSHPLEGTVEAFERLVQDGKIGAWGVSNFDVDELDEVHALAPGKVACNQVLYHLEERAIEHRVLPWCEQHGVPVVGYSPLGAGHFVSPRSRGGQVLARIAARLGATPRQVAIAFLVRRPSLLTIPKAARQAHAVENANAGSLVLTPADLHELDAAFPPGDDPALPSL